MDIYFSCGSPPLPRMASMIEVTNDTSKLKNNADTHPSTVKPGTIEAAHFTMIILMTKRKSPSVKIVMGIVSKIRTGLMKLFNNPSTTATINAVSGSFTSIPRRIYAANKMASVLAIVFVKKRPI